MKKFYGCYFCFLACIVLTACDFSFKGSENETEVKLTELPVPEINENSYDPSTNIISWGSVYNCDGYTIKVDNREYITTSLNYTISFSESKDFTFAIKARGKSLYTTDSLWSKEFTWRYTKNNDDNSLLLDFPKNIDYKDNKITWDVVSLASYYEVEISENDITCSYNRSANYFDVQFPYSTVFSYKVRSVKIFEDKFSFSSWSAKQIANYIKPTSKITFNNTHFQKGLGRTVDLLNGTYNKVMVGGSSIFDENKLSKLYVSTNSIRSGHQVTYMGDSLEKYIEDYTFQIGAKASLSKIKPGQKKLVSQKGLSLDLSYDFEYNNRTESETNYYFYTYENSWMDEEIYFDAYRNSAILSNALSTQFLNDARALQSSSTNENINKFINTYGTHLVTDAIFGAKLSVDYSLIGEKISVDEKSKHDVKFDLGISRNYWETSANLNVNLDSNKYNSSSNVISNLSVNFMGGKNVGFAFDKNDLNGFASFYKNWAESTNDSNNNVLIDVRDNSLYCIWDLLDDNEFGLLKKALDKYFDKFASDSYLEYLSKIKKFIKDSGNFQDGSKQNPYLISTPLELFGIRNFVDNDIYFKLTNDIDLKNAYWTYMDIFYGHLDGQNYTISNFKINNKFLSTQENQTDIYSAFILKNYGTIENLKMFNVDVEVTYSSFSNNVIQLCAASLIAYNYGTINNFEISNSSIKATNMKDPNRFGELYPNLILRVGGIVGFNEGEINFAKISNSTIIGITDADRNKCSTYTSTGGVAGINAGRCSNIIVEDINVTCNSRGGYYVFTLGGGYVRTYAGYILGENYGCLEYCVCNNNNSSISTKNELLANFTGQEDYLGIIVGNYHVEGASQRFTYCLHDGFYSACGNDASYYNDAIKDSINEIQSYIMFWPNWKYDKGFKFYFS